MGFGFAAQRGTVAEAVIRLKTLEREFRGRRALPDPAQLPDPEDGLLRHAPPGPR